MNGHRGVFQANDFLHPLDLSARQQLEAVPYLEKLVQAWTAAYSEKKSRQVLLSRALRLSPRQLPEYYRLLPPICEAFDIPQPELFLMPGEPNAWTTGHSRTAIVVHSGLLENLDLDEIQAVLAHECGHIMARHVLYRQMAQSLMNLGGLAGLLGSSPARLASLLTTPLQLALYNWYRKSELTADRAAAAFMGRAEPMQLALFRFVGVSRLWPGTISYAEFTAQGEEYERQVQNSPVERFVALQLESTTTHPNPPARIRELTEWSQSHAFNALQDLAAAGGLREREGCLRCGHEIQQGWKFCQVCGVPAGRGTREEIMP